MSLRTGSPRLARDSKVRITHIGPEHHPKDPGMNQCELNIGISRGRQDRPAIRAFEPLASRGKPVRELIEALAHQRRQDRLPIGEVVVGRLMRTTGTTRHLTHAQRARARLIQELPTGSQQLGTQVSTVTAAGGACRFRRHTESVEPLN